MKINDVMMFGTEEVTVISLADPYVVVEGKDGVAVVTEADLTPVKKTKKK